ncbi:MAG: GNAT family N-acetyltransferase, partial [Bryobacteraceae bacterium]|nr:GNAT family N-acetyltransferase [Bryobacteraceae bacterium]
MTIYEINPLTDGRWGELVERHPAGSLFHTCGWLEALWRTYGFESVALTTSAPGEALANGLVYSRVRSWLTGRRLVSVPFSDHCEPLVRGAGDLAELLEGFRGRVKEGRYGYGEIRPWVAAAGEYLGFRPGQSYVAHRLDLRVRAEAVFRGFHKDCVQRKIRRAEREGVVVEKGNSAGLLEEFYGLMIQTRKRHGLPPQPLDWFRNLGDCLGAALTVWVARKDGRAAAAILTGRQGRVVVYKYGASVARMHALGCMPYLMWRAAEDGVERGMEWLDLGRSDIGQSGLIAFKDHLGAERSLISYWRWPE